jgi:uncharacterized protein (DUF1697 family)
MIKYVVFLRGINVGGKMLSMEKLRLMLEKMGYTDVKTLLNSGNVILESNEKKDVLASRIEKEIEKVFGLSVDVLIRSMGEIQKLVTDNPFKDIVMTPGTRLYVTFLSRSPWIRTSVLTLSDNNKTTDMMKDLEKEFGKKITTRNWNTVVKIAAY